MNRLFDVLLPRPLPPVLYHPLEFLFFVAHFFFVLITLGTAFFAVLAIYRRLRPGAGAPPVDPEENRTHSGMPVYFASKSLMITFGIAVLLLVMAFYSVAFTGAANLNGGIWMAIIVLLSAALVVLEVFDRKSRGVARVKTMWMGIIGLVLLMTIPAIFVTFVVTAENPGRWAGLVHRNVVFTPLVGHWLARLLHVYGAAAVIAGMFYLAYSRARGKRSPVGPNVVFAALMVQIVLGVLLYMSMPATPNAVMNFFVVLGVAAAAGFGWLMYSGRAQKGRGILVYWSIGLILIPMLLARQINQENALVPFRARLERNANEYRALVKRYAPPPGRNPYFEEKYDAYNLPQFIFQRSCAFCHSGVGDGNGSEAANLKIAPANLTQIRAHRSELLDVLRHGVPGTAMPYFKIYTGGALKGLTDYLYREVGVRKNLEPVPVPVAPEDERQAAMIFDRQCAGCHGNGGKPGGRGKSLQPPARDMTVWALSPQASFTAISEGVRGTSMPGYGQLPEGLRWALVKFVGGFYRNENGGGKR